MVLELPENFYKFLHINLKLCEQSCKGNDRLTVHLLLSQLCVILFIYFQRERKGEG